MVLLAVFCFVGLVFVAVQQWQIEAELREITKNIKETHEKIKQAHERLNK